MNVVNLTSARLPELSALLNRLGRHGFRRWPAGPDELAADLNSSRLDYGTDVFVAVSEDAVCGYSLALPELDIERSVIGLGFDGECARYADRLLEAAVNRARDQGARLAHAAAVDRSGPVAAALTGHRFNPLLDLVEMVAPREAFSGVSGEALPPGFAVRPMRAGSEVPLLTRLQNAIFRGHWGFSQNSEDEIAASLGLADSGPEHVMLLLDEAGGAAGYVWTALERDGDHTRGRILMTGVEPPYRGMGLGKKIAGAGIRHLLAAGAADIHLEVISENAAAIAIYNGLGFRETGRVAWYELRLK